VARTRRKVEDWEAQIGTTSFDPLEAMDLVDAIKARKKSVVLGERTFYLDYDPKRVHYRPDRGFVPCGWIDLDRIERGW